MPPLLACFSQVAMPCVGGTLDLGPMRVDSEADVMRGVVGFRARVMRVHLRVHFHIFSLAYQSNHLKVEVKDLFTYSFYRKGRSSNPVLEVESRFLAHHGAVPRRTHPACGRCSVFTTQEGSCSDPPRAAELRWSQLRAGWES